MGMPAAEVKQLLKERGWSMVDLAARWQISITWISRLVNRPHSRPAMYEDAFRGLPAFEKGTVQREARHTHRKRPTGFWTAAQMFPVGRVFETEDSTWADQGTQVVVRAVVGEGELARVLFDIAGQSEPLELPLKEAGDRLADLGYELQQDHKKITKPTPNG